MQGWADDAIALVPGRSWGFNPASITCPTRFWHADNDVNTPLSAVRRLVETIPGAGLNVWHGGGHTAPSRNAEQVLRDLVACWS